MIAALAVVGLLAATAVHGEESLEAFGLLIAGQSRPSFAIIGAGARAAGMGGAFTALADDASAASFNPAGLALLIRPETSFVLDGQRRRDGYPAFTNVEHDELELYSGSASSFSTADLNFAAFTVPFRVVSRNLCLQLSYHRLIDFTFDSRREFTESFADDEPFAEYLQEVEQSGDIHTFSLAAAYQLTQRLSLGASVARWEGDWSFRSRNFETDLPEAEVDRLVFQQDNHLTGWNVDLGFLLRYRYLNIGGMFRLGFDADYTYGSFLDTNVATQLTSEPAVTRRLHWPSSSTFGIALKPTPTWHVTVDYSRFHWSDMEIRGLGEDGSSRLNFFDLKPSAETTTPDVTQWRFGTEYTFFAGQTPLSVRGGYFREPEPRGTALEGSTTFTGYSAGFGFTLGNLSIDLAYQRRSGDATIRHFIDPSIIATGRIEAQAQGELETTDERVYVALLYQFSSGERLRKAWHFLFVGPTKKDSEGPESGDAQPDR